MPSSKTIGRLSLYRRLLGHMAEQGLRDVFSHQLAARAGVTSAQVRRDLMHVGGMGNSARGYSIGRLYDAIGHFLAGSQRQSVALVGVGNLGRAILAFFFGRHPQLAITVTFDKDPDKIGRVILGHRCYDMDQLESVLAEDQINVAILAVPADNAQQATEALVRAGVRGILNFTPIPLRTPADVYVEDVDMTTSLEKVVFFANQSSAVRETVR
mgnify:CR=1 FL=1